MVVKYVESSPHRPHHRFEVVLCLRPASQSEEQPFAELDAPYRHILPGVAEDSILFVLHVPSLVPFSQDSHAFVTNIKPIIQLEDDATQDPEEAKCLYRHCLGQLREALISQISGLGIYDSQSESRFALHLVTLLCHYPSSLRYVRSKSVKLPSIPPASLVAQFTLYDRTSPEYQHSPDFRLLPSTYDVMGLKDGYIKLLSLLSLLSDPEDFSMAGNSVSQESQRTFAKEVYAGAARCSLEFLCGITDSDSLVTSHRRFDLYNSSLRRNSPWKWRRYFGKGGSCRARKHYRLVRPLAFVSQQVSFGYVSPTLIMNKTKSKPNYFHAYFSVGEPFLDDSIVLNRIQSEKYLLALGYLVFFLPMAGRSESLLQLCRMKGFSQRCCEYPKRTKEARRAIEKYLSRMER